MLKQWPEHRQLWFRESGTEEKTGGRSRVGGKCLLISRVRGQTGRRPWTANSKSKNFLALKKNISEHSTDSVRTQFVRATSSSKVHSAEQRVQLV